MPIESTVQTENEKALLKYPFSEEATLVDDSGLDLPVSAVENIMVTSFVELTNLRVSSLHLSQSLLSITVSDDNGPVLCGMYSSATSSVRDLALDSMRDGVSGRITFGDVQYASPVTFKFSSHSQSAIHAFCILCFPRMGIQKFVDDKSGNEAAGDVKLSFGSGISVTVNNGKIHLAVTDSVTNTLSSGCVPTSLNESCVAPVVQTINGVEPAFDGTIALVFM